MSEQVEPLSERAEQELRADVAEHASNSVLWIPAGELASLLQELDRVRAELSTARELADEWQSLARQERADLEAAEVLVDQWRDVVQQAIPQVPSQERERDADRTRAVEFCKTVLSIVADGGCQDGGKCGECVVCGARIGIEWLEKLSHE